MSKAKVLCAVLIALALSLAASSAAQAQGGRQYYSRYWQRHGGYYYRNYYYQPTAGAGYRYHRVIYYPSQPNYYYYYNPYSKRYWGRYCRAEQGYAKLAPADQRETLADVPADAFPQPGKMPDMPESEDGTQMQTPPDSTLPPDESGKLGKDELQKRLPRMGGKEPPRQVYSDWCKHGGYYYCCYYCQPQAGGRYLGHRCIYYPSQPKYVYYYNTGNGKYWGRYDLEANGYSLLRDEDKAGRLADIPEKAFPAPGALPPIPGSSDSVQMTRPPRELPE